MKNCTKSIFSILGLSLLFLIGFIAPISYAVLDPGDGGGGGTSTTESKTYKHDAGLGFWVETTLTVILHTSSGGDKTFYYYMSHRESKPWCSSWYTPHCWAKLYEESPGVWTAENFRKIIMWLPLPFIAYMKVCVHFKESDMTFYYSVKYYDNGVALFSALFEWLADW